MEWTPAQNFAPALSTFESHPVYTTPQVLATSASWRRGGVDSEPPRYETFRQANQDGVSGEGGGGDIRGHTNKLLHNQTRQEMRRGLSKCIL